MLLLSVYFPKPRDSFGRPYIYIYIYLGLQFGIIYEIIKNGVRIIKFCLFAFQTREINLANHIYIVICVCVCVCVITSNDNKKRKKLRKIKGFAI